MSAAVFLDMNVFLDRGGMLTGSASDPLAAATMRLRPGAAEALARFAAAGLALAVISNQPGVAHGLFDLAELDGVAARLRARLPALERADVRFCPHDPDGRVAPYAVECACRKPGPLMPIQSAIALGVDLAESWMIGDLLDDVEAGRRAGCRTILVLSGRETAWRGGRYRDPHHRVRDLAAATDLILARQRWVA